MHKTSQDQDTRSPIPRRRCGAAWCLASTLGNAFEWFDYGIFGMFAPIISKLFFPAGSELTSMLLTFATFAVAFAMRPLERRPVRALCRSVGAQARVDADDHHDGGRHRHDRFAADLCCDRRRGTAADGGRKIDPGHLRRRRVRQCHRDAGRVFAGEPPRLLRQLPDGVAGAWLHGRRAAGLSRHHLRVAGVAGKLGLAASVPAWNIDRAVRLLASFQHRRNAGIPALSAIDAEAGEYASGRAVHAASARTRGRASASW